MAHNGTSMAAPHVAGAAAIIAQQHPDRNGERIKAALVESAKAGGGWTALVTNPRDGRRPRGGGRRPDDHPRVRGRLVAGRPEARARDAAIPARRRGLRVAARL
ncbi:S8 family serine peptidase [Nonomuraea sp. NPDC003709]|uniref:S8 family serine peptidase n=1 Tax=Nonomuraea sp. NPDC003709 TaxID=3154450 RepID=UPI0033BC0CA1